MILFSLQVGLELFLLFLVNPYNHGIDGSHSTSAGNHAEFRESGAERTGDLCSRDFGSDMLDGVSVDANIHQTAHQSVVCERGWYLTMLYLFPTPTVG